MTNEYSELTPAVPVQKITAPHVALVVLERCIIPYGIPNTIMTGNGPQFVSNFFAALCASLQTKLVSTTEYHPQTNGNVERFDKTLVARLRHYIDEHQSNWDTFIQTLFMATTVKCIALQIRHLSVWYRVANSQMHWCSRRLWLQRSTAFHHLHEQSLRLAKTFVHGRKRLKAPQRRPGNRINDS